MVEKITRFMEWKLLDRKHQYKLGIFASKGNSTWEENTWSSEDMKIVGVSGASGMWGRGRDERERWRGLGSNPQSMLEELQSYPELNGKPFKFSSQSSWGGLISVEKSCMFLLLMCSWYSRENYLFLRWAELRFTHNLSISHAIIFIMLCLKE